MNGLVVPGEFTLVCPKLDKQTLFILNNSGENYKDDDLCDHASYSAGNWC